MNPYTFSGILAGVTSSVIGLLVLLKTKNKKIGRIWFLLSMSIAMWGFGGCWTGLAKTPQEAIIAWRLAFSLGVVWIPPLFYHFICVFCDLKRRTSIIVHYAIAAAFFATMPTRLFFADVRWVFGEFYYATPGFVLPIFTILWIGSVIYSHREMILAFPSRTPIKRMQIKYFFLATAVGYSGGSLDYLPFFGIDLYPWGNFSIFLYPIIMSYSILRYRMWDLRILFKSATSYIFSALLIGFIPAFVVVLITDDYKLGGIIQGICLIVPYLTNKMNRWLGELRVKRGLLDQDQSRIVKSISDRIQGAGNTIADLGDTVTKLIYDEFPTNKCGVFFFDHEANNYFLQSQIGIEMKFFPRIKISDPLIKYFETEKEKIVVSEIRQTLDKSKFDLISKTVIELGVEVCAPMFIRKNISGFMVLGPKLDGRPFFVNELIRLQEIANETGHSLRYALGRLEDISKTRKWAHSLHQSLKALKSAFDYFKYSDPNFEKNQDKIEAHKEGLKVINRQNLFFKHLVHTNRIESEAQKNTYQVKLLNISKVLKDSLNDYHMLSKRMNVEAQLDIKDKNVNIYGNEFDLKSVFDSILSNAFRYVPEQGCVKLSGEKGEEFYKITIYNNGPSIPEKNFEDIFLESFQIRDGFQGASGLGLANSKKIVELHNGKISTKNGENNVGVKFIIYLPINNDQGGLDTDEHRTI